MRRNCVLLLSLILTLQVSFLRADIGAIHASALPQETAVLAALDEAKQLEAYSQSWTSDWKFSVPKDEVAARLSKDLGFLTLALKNHPENEELALLTGLVARYAYNLDVDGAFDSAMRALAEAEKLLPTDFRAPWFRATLQCQTTESTPGAETFLSIEAGHAWDQLPIAFWDDYMECAALTNMPAHLLRAANYTEKMHAPASAMRAFLRGAAQKRFDAYDPNKTYQPKEVWEGESSSADVTFTSTMCGVRLRTHGAWEVDNISFNNGTCVANFCSGPYKSTARSLRPCMSLLARQPKEGESLLDFAKLFMKKGQFLSDDSLKCPASDCVAMKGVQRGMYKADGDGHGRFVVFERDQPMFPGLIFESPSDLPKSNGATGVAYCRPNQIQERMPGKLYYLVLLDTAASIEDPATKDFDFFLENMKVE